MTSMWSPSQFWSLLIWELGIHVMMAGWNKLDKWEKKEELSRKIQSRCVRPPVVLISDFSSSNYMIRDDVSLLPRSTFVILVPKENVPRVFHLFHTMMMVLFIQVADLSRNEIIAWQFLVRTLHTRHIYPSIDFLPFLVPWKCEIGSVQNFKGLLRRLVRVFKDCLALYFPLRNCVQTCHFKIPIFIALFLITMKQ